MNSQRQDLCRAVLAARDEVYRLQIAALMPGLTAGQLKSLKRQERAARQERRRLCELVRRDIRTRMPPAQLQLPLPRCSDSSSS
jgi:hypothetical protein